MMYIPKILVQLKCCKGDKGMAKRPRGITSTKIAKWIAEGRGQGRGVAYKPWLRIQDVPSHGYVHRIKGWKTERVHHLMSDLERNYFYILEWSSHVIDIREQYPLLPIEDTLSIAEEFNLHHPRDPKTQEPIVMTTDFLITTQVGIGVVEEARTIKPSEKLQENNILEKLAIEYQYWSRRGISWGIVTEQQIPKTVARNIQYLHKSFYREKLFFSDSEMLEIKNFLIGEISQGGKSLKNIITSCEGQFKLKPGQCLPVIKYLLATRQWLIDMTQPIDPRKQLNLLFSSSTTATQGTQNEYSDKSVI